MFLAYLLTHTSTLTLETESRKRVVQCTEIHRTKVFFSPIIPNPNLKRYARYAYIFRIPIKNI